MRFLLMKEFVAEGLAVKRDLRAGQLLPNTVLDVLGQVVGLLKGQSVVHEDMGIDEPHRARLSRPEFVVAENRSRAVQYLLDPVRVLGWKLTIEQGTNCRYRQAYGRSQDQDRHDAGKDWIENRVPGQDDQPQPDKHADGRKDVRLMILGFGAQRLGIGFGGDVPFLRGLCGIVWPACAARV